MEKRKRPRVDFVITARFENGEHDPVEYRCQNVSMSGVFLQTDNPLAVGTSGRLSILLASGEERLEVRGECQVVRTIGIGVGIGGNGSAGMGLEFVNLDYASSITLHNMVRYQGGLDG